MDEALDGGTAPWEHGAQNNKYTPPFLAREEQLTRKDHDIRKSGPGATLSDLYELEVDMVADGTHNMQ